VEKAPPEEKLRMDAQSTVVTGVYYLVDGVIYQAPTMMSILESRIVRIPISLHIVEEIVAYGVACILW
jgi:hypothetical protein